MTGRHDSMSGTRTPRRRRSGTQRRPTFPRPLDPDEWRGVVRALGLSPRQARIVQLMLRGHRDKQIAREMGVTLATVRTYLGRVFDRLLVSDRVELLLRVWVASRDLERRNGCPQE